MKITIENTTKIVALNGINCRVWEGATESGIPIHCFIPRIAVAVDKDCSQFERELEEQAAPSPVIDAIPLRMLI